MDEENNVTETDESEPEPKAKRRKFSEDEYRIKVLIPGGSAGGVIGKGGENLNRVQAEHNVRFKMSRNREYFPDTEERVVLLSGSLEAIVKGVEYLNAKLREKPDWKHNGDQYDHRNSDRMDEAKLVILDSTARLVVGRGGATIKEIEANTGAIISVSKDVPNNVEHMHERVITVVGTSPDGLDNACRQVIEHMVGDRALVVNNDYTSVHYENDQYPPNDRMRGGYDDSRSSGTVAFNFNAAAYAPMHRSDPVPLSMEEIADVQRFELLQRDLINRGVPSNDAIGAVSALHMLCRYKITDLLEAFIVDLHTRRMRTASEKANGQWGRPPMARPVGMPAPVPPQHHMNGGPEITQTMEVQDKLVGKIMGREGQTLLELERRSGARIEVDRRGDVPAGSARVITIHGNRGSVERARGLIEDALAGRGNFSGQQRR